jgi:hypothetical protein
MKRLLCTAVLLAAIAPLAALSETAQAQGELMRPGDEDGTALASDGLAECAAILAVASTTSSNIVDRNNMNNASAGWFAAAGDQASEEGALPEAEVWEDKVSSWASQIGSVDALSRYPDWMTYCSGIGAQRGLDNQFFVVPES